MRTVVATAPDGTQWRVRVAWQPRWGAMPWRFTRWALNRDKDVGFPGFGGADSIEDVIIWLVAGVAITLIALLFGFVLLPLLLLVVDLVVIVVVLALAIPMRVLLRRPWTVEAVAQTPAGFRKFVAGTVGWRRALRLRDEAARQLREGRPPPQGLVRRHIR